MHWPDDATAVLLMARFRTDLIIIISVLAHAAVCCYHRALQGANDSTDVMMQ